jgi:RNA recognition motif-containing protein
MKKLYVGNMSFETTESELRSLFEPFGEVGDIHIATDRATGRARGFAFVEMIDDESASKAMAELNGKVVAGRALNVNEARPKPQQSFGGGGKRRGGGRFSRDDYRGSARQPREPRW